MAHVQHLDLGISQAIGHECCRHQHREGGFAAVQQGKDGLRNGRGLRSEHADPLGRDIAECHGQEAQRHR